MSSHLAQPPGLRKVALAAVKPNVSRHTGHCGEAAHPPLHHDGGAENAESIPGRVPATSEDATANGEAEPHIRALPATGPLCLVSFTGFRDDDDDADNDEDQQPHQAPGTASAVQTTTALRRYERLALFASPSVRVQSTLTSATTVLVARRGFTQKRLLAARRGIPVVHPGWVEGGCPPLSISSNPPGDAAPSATCSSISAYVVPWLHGYVFSTTGLSTSERAAIERVCGVHGASVEAALTYRCDVLLTCAECVQALQGLLAREDGDRTGASRRHQRLRQHELLSPHTPLASTADASDVAASLAPWLTDKIRSALEQDIPVVDYVRLFSLLRLDRLPPPTWRPSTALRDAAGPPSAGASAESEAAFRGALEGRDFDSLVEACRVGAPADGSVGWHRLLRQASGLTQPREGHHDGGAAVKEGAGSDAEEVFLATAADGLDDDRSSRSSSSAASGTTCTASASTVSDPDAWEDFLSSALAASLHAPEPHHGAWRAMTINTADVDVIADTYADTEHATAHVPFADYYSATDTAAGDAAPMTDVLSAPVEAREPTQARAGEKGHLLWGMATVDPSPRLTTNALLQRDTSKPRPVTNSDCARGATAGEKRGGLVAPSPGDCTAAYYAAHRTTGRLAAPLPVALGRPANSMADSQPAQTQVLVESCQMPDQLELTGDVAAHAAASSAVCVDPPSKCRFTLPLMALHPPYLAVCLLGCTDAELQQAAQWCAQCRLLRSPVPTPSTDLVVLGSRVLAKRRYTMRTDADGAHGGAGTDPRQPHTSLRRAVAAAAQQQQQQHERRNKRAGEGAVRVTVRYWEADAAIARTLADVCGLPLSRLVPLLWLEDAAAAVAAAQPPSQQEGACTELTADAAPEEWGTATTLPDTLGAEVQSRMAAAAVAAEAERAAALEVAEKEQQRPVFHPLPALAPEQLPSTSEPTYYIRFRRASSGAPWAGDLASAAGAAPAAAPASPPPTDATDHSAPVRDTALLSFFQVSGTRHSADTTAAAAAASSATVSAPASVATSTTVPLPGQPSQQQQQEALHGSSISSGVAAAAEPHRRCEESDHEAALATAGRRFNGLVALFAVTDEVAQGAGAATQHDAARRVADATTGVSSRRAQSFAACVFCCVEGEYARVDWAVVRGLVRYGGGRVEKRTGEEWHAALQLLGPNASAKSAAGAARADVEATAASMLPDSVMRALRWNGEHAKLRQKLRRAQQRQGGVSAPGSDHRVALLAGAESAEGQQTGGGDVDDDSKEGGAGGAATVARLSAKLQRVAQHCERVPVLCLVPHSFQRAAANTASETESASVSSSAVPSPHPRRHVLSRLLPVTTDYVLASLAVGRCLDPRACFLFHECIPSAPDMRLFHHTPTCGGGGGGPAGGESHATSAQARRPALSPWLLERRYSKADAVGVCVAVLWRLPAPPPPLTQPDAVECWSQVDASTARAAPSASLVPLLRVLLLGLRNAVTALGGQLLDQFAPSAVTHVLVMDVDKVVTSSLRDAFASRAPAEVQEVVADTTACAYWPLEYDLSELVQGAARDDVSLVGPAWLAACVQWGAFIEEKEFAAPADLVARVEAERHKRAFAAAHAAQTKARLQEQHLQRRAREAASHPARSAAVQRHSPALAPPNASGSQRKRERTPPLQREHANVAQVNAEEEPTQQGCRTPVMRRAVGGAGEERRDEPCTPPPRPPHPQPSPPQPEHQGRARTPAGSGSDSCSIGFIRTGSITHTPPPTSVGLEHARRRSSPSASQHNTWSLMEQHDAEAYVEHLGGVFNFCSPGSTPLPTSARRRNDRERSTAAYAEAGASLLAHLMPHTQPSQPSAGAAASAHATPERLVQPAPRSTSLSERHSTPTSSQRTRVLTPAAGPPRASALQALDAHGGTSVVSTPRRRTLREVAAATAAAVSLRSPSLQQPALSSPDRQRRRTEGGRALVVAATAELYDAQPSPVSPDSALTASNAAAAGLSAAGPDVLGGSTMQSTRCGTEEGSVRVAGTNGTVRRSTAHPPPPPQATDHHQSLKEAEPSSIRACERNAESVVDPTPPQSPPPVPSLSAPVHAGTVDAAGFSWMDEVVPDSLHAVMDDVLEPASFVAATAEAYEPAPAVAEVPATAAADSAGLGELLGGEGDGIEGAVVQPLDKAGASLSLHRAVAVAGSDAAGATGAPQSAPTSALRQASPSPCPPPARAREVVDVDDEDKPAEPRCVNARDGVVGGSPWTRHRPLSLSRRPSRSPPPPQTPRRGNSTAAARSASAVRRAPTPSPAPTSGAPQRWRVYVLHDVPLRDVRLRRCHEALNRFMCKITRDAEGDTEPCPPHGAASPASADSTAATAPPVPSPHPPLVFVSRCEDADVLVTHDVNLRESVLVAVAVGCWVVAPRFMEVAAAVLRDAGGNGGDGRAASHGVDARPAVEWGGAHGPVLALRPALAPPAPAAVHAACLARLLDALQECEWEPDMLPRTAVTSTAADADAAAAVQRSLVLQCRPQRQARAAQVVKSSAAAGRVAAASSPPRSLFRGHSFLCLYAEGRAAACDRDAGEASLSTGSPVRRLQAIGRVVVAGGGRVCAAVKVGSRGEAEQSQSSPSVTAAGVAVSSCTPPLRPRPATAPELRCCTASSAATPTPSRRARHGNSNEGASDASCVVVTDAALFSDLAWLLCRAVCEHPAETLVVLLDASLLRLPCSEAPAEAGGGTVRVSVSGPGPASPVAPCGGDGVPHEVPEQTTLHPSKKRRTEAGRANVPRPGKGDPAAPSAHTCTVAQWLASWLLLPPSPSALTDPTLEEFVVAGSPYTGWGYTAATAAALRAHLRACCRAALTPPVDGCSAEHAQERLADDAIKRLPFDAPAVARVREVFAASDAAAVPVHAGVPERRGGVRRIEFRSSSWVGACVSAGGAAALAAGAVTTGSGRASDAQQSWMRLCEAQTLWGSLSLA